MQSFFGIAATVAMDALLAQVIATQMHSLRGAQCI
jgi:hypothetical protein